MRTALLKPRQHGAALMVMLVIMVVGSAAVLVGSLNSSAIRNARLSNNSAALAQAKEALIARATTDVTVLGSLPCPDTNNDGTADLLVGNECPSYIGRLPWKTLLIDDLRDAQGERLWYALSRNFRDDNSNHINSDTLGTLNLTGGQTASQVIAIVFSAGSPLAAQTRSATNTMLCNGVSLLANLCVQNYLEASNAAPSTATSPNNTYQINAPSNTFNDQAIYLTHEQLFPVVEQRIAREVKSCLDNYATVMGNHYPWAVPVKNWYLSGEHNTRFGRIPYQKPINNNKIQDFLAALDNLQNQVNACIANDTNSNAYALDNAGETLEDASKALGNKPLPLPPLSTAVTNPSKKAGDKAQDNNMCDSINSNPSNNSVQTNLNATLAALASELANEIATNNSDQAVRCDALFQKAYWQDWKDLVFYQVDEAYRPGGGGAGAGIQINATGNYHAAVLIARAVLPPKTLPRKRTVLSDYLETPNAHTGQNPLATFSRYRTSDAQYQTISNDLVLCLDGGSVNCK